MNIFLENLAVALGCLIVGYLFGSIPNGVIIGRVFFKKDPRDYGSHNSGGTNSGRVFGKWIGITVIVLDMLKAVAAFWVVWAFLRFSGIRISWQLWDDGIFYNWLAMLGVSLGHCWSAFIKFRGGKTVACYMGLIGGTSWAGFLLCWLAFMPIFLTKRIVSKASLISGGILCVAEWLLYIVCSAFQINGSFLFWSFGNGGGLVYGVWSSGWEAAVIATAVYAILVARHHENIKRIRNGTEAPLQWPSK